MRPWCDYDLRDTPLQSAAPELCAAQELLTAWAVALSAPATACGLAITGRIGVHAFVDLVDASVDGAAHTIVQLASPPQQSAAGYLAAAKVLTRSTIDAAAAVAEPLLRYDGPHAPIRPASLIETHPYSPLLAAVQLHGIRDRLAPTDQLTCRTSHPVARYPATLSPDTRSRLRLPDHRILRPEREDRWFPPCLWADAVPAVVGGPAASPLHRACLAMALAKCGSGRGWADIANTLGLPPVMANSIGAVLQSWVRVNMWPGLLGFLDGLLGRLQVGPPPIDYLRRRDIARDLDLLDRALQARVAPTRRHCPPSSCGGSSGRRPPAETSATAPIRTD